MEQAIDKAAEPATETIPEAEPPKVYATFNSENSLKERMERHTRSTLKKEFGVESTEDLKLKFGKLAELEAREEEQRKASMSREQQLQEELEALRREKTEIAARAEKAEFDAHTTRLFSKLGIKQNDYAVFKLSNANKGEGFNDEAFFAGLLEDPRERVALGIDDVVPPAARTVTLAANTTSHDNMTAPKPPLAGSPTGTKSAFEDSPEEYRRRKAMYGIF